MTDPLVSWNDSAAKQAILDFVAKVTTPNSPSFVPLGDRIAVFDNDGILWVEQVRCFKSNHQGYCWHDAV
jgi:hypothetical protein